MLSRNASRMVRASALRQPISRPFSAAPVLRIKEDADRSAAELEKTKQEHLKKQQQGKGEWDESLASAGEVGVKADREEVKDHDKHIERLQKETAQKAK